MDHLIDRYLPRFDFNEIHKIQINTRSDRVYPETLQMNLNTSWVTKILFRLRGLPSSDISLKNMISQGPFKILEEKENREIVIGMVMDQRMVPDFNYNWDLDQNRSRSKQIKIAWNFLLEENQGTRLTTETRITCSDRSTRICFMLYWIVIRPFSGLIRHEMLKTIKRQAEKPFI